MPRFRIPSAAFGACALFLAASFASCDSQEPDSKATPAAILRVATFNIWELSRSKLDHRDAEGRYLHPQLASAAEVIQRVRPDIILLNEIDFDEEERENARLFVERYLEVSQGGQKPISYPHIFFERSNTGLASGHDLDQDGTRDGPADAFGFGRYPGQYAMALLSRHPIDHQAARTFRLLPWRTMPHNLMPNGKNGKPAFYDAKAVSIFRLSSKSHWDVPIRVGDRTLHILASHPTPPVFDGEEDRNGRRNFDEIRFWVDYLSGGQSAAYISDDVGNTGPLARDEKFVLLGDLNADPNSNSSSAYGQSAINQLLKHPRLQDPCPAKTGKAGDQDTSHYGRIDYALPSRNLKLISSNVFWPEPNDPLHRLVEGPQRASDHALVWIDIKL